MKILIISAQIAFYFFVNLLFDKVFPGAWWLILVVICEVIAITGLTMIMGANNDNPTNTHYNEDEEEESI